MYDEVVDDRGYKYFVNREGNKMKECPLLIKIVKAIKTDFNDVKYNTYRCVLKVQNLKLLLSTYCISYRAVVSIIQKHKSGSSSQQIAPRELTDIVNDIFFATEKAGFYEDNKTFRLETATSILTNFLWNIFDAKRVQNISMLEFQLAMLILCELDPVNTFHQIIDSHFEIVKDFNHCITKPRFEEFINVFNKILSYLGEPLYFDQTVVNDILTEAFALSPGINGINQFSFFNLWTNHHQNTKFSLYTNLFLLLIRFKKSEGVVHHSECAGCKKFPIVGLRYKCQRCTGFSLCFDCFSKGFTNKRHSRGHRFYEMTSNEREQTKWYSFFLKFLNGFKRRSSSQRQLQSIHVNAPSADNTKLIEDEHIELMQIDDDMEGGTSAVHGRRGTLRSEVFNNSENLLILQRNLMDKLLSTIDALRTESDAFHKMTCERQNQDDANFEKFLKTHGAFLSDQIEVLKQIHEATCQSISSTQNNKTIKSFTSPSKSIFLPSSTPYVVKEKPKLLVDPILCKSINGYELNKSYVAKNEEFSISDLSTFFQTKVPVKGSKNGLIAPSKNDDTVTKIDNFKHLLKQVKEIVDDSFCDNVELARTTEMFSKALDQVIEVEEMKRTRD